ncbi:MAG: NAD(P)/FAD-dependent oxidoreductase [Lachnospiraceae bacterium]|nr:NAD(P)/FAD-dependent oxidoreductase [Lachnospiraceae bacterium]
MSALQWKLSQLHLPVTHTPDALRQAAASALRVPEGKIANLEILKQSLDARKKREIAYSYELAVALMPGTKLPKHLPANVTPYAPVEFEPSGGGTKPLRHRPVVIGAGPAGLFATLELAKKGYRPILLERGKAIAERVSDVEGFFKTGRLNPESNVQFGVGGAGTFSDGKLNTLIKDKDGRGRYVLKTFVSFGAPEEIVYKNKPHIGTDRLREVITEMTKEIERLGGEVRVNTTVTSLVTDNGALSAVVCADGTEIPTTTAILAIGHSARDTFEMLHSMGIAMEPKAFAMGVRVQHAREWVNRTQYGEFADRLPSADYKVTYTDKNGRGVYSFCMCPGGYVVNASSENGRLAINGMSNYKRDADNSNAAIVVTVTPADFASEADAANPADPLIGMRYQRNLEELAYRAGDGNIPTQRYADFRAKTPSTGCGAITPVNKGAVTYTDLHRCLPEFMAEAIAEGMEAFDKTMPGFADPDVLLQAIESRTSSPVRILRDESLQACGVAGLYPCGEGAGYAGGIMSAALDGIRCSEAVMKEYAVPTE